MEARLGVYEKAPYQPIGATEGVDHQSALLRAEGGHRQQERMIQAKRKSFDRALFNSYQAAEIRPVRNNLERIRALINPNITKQDYDDKVLSVGYESNLKPGDVFEWIGTGTHWLIYLQDLTELAYFKGDIRKCNYSVKWENEQGKICSTWFAIRGPVETSINSIAKSNISIDVPNHSLNILMPKNEETLKYFKRYSKFYISGADEKICWRVEATDSISMPGILEINAVEYYANEHEDDLKNGIVGGLIELNTPEPEEIYLNPIQGESFIKPKQTYEYVYKGNEVATWVIDSKLPVEAKAEGSYLTIKWLKTFSGEFKIKYGTSEKTIVVESLF